MAETRFGHCFIPWCLTAIGATQTMRTEQDFLKNPQLWKLVYNKETQFLPGSVLKGFTFL